MLALTPVVLLLFIEPLRANVFPDQTMVLKFEESPIEILILRCGKDAL